MGYRAPGGGILWIDGQRSQPAISLLHLLLAINHA
jgi:hypothetical protein